MVQFGKEFNPDAKLAWRLHIDISGIREKKPGAVAIWNRFYEYLKAMDEDDVMMFQPNLVPDGLMNNEEVRAAVVEQYPGIDPLSPKNRDIDYEEMKRAIEEEINPHIENPIDVTKPHMIMGGRFDYWKGLISALKAFEQNAKVNKDIELILVGSYANDDPEGVEHYEIVKNIIDNSKYKDRIHLITHKTPHI